MSWSDAELEPANSPIATPDANAPSDTNGRRFTDLEELQAAVIVRSAQEFQERWPSIAIEDVATLVDRIRDASVQSGAARRALSRLLDELRSCVELAKGFDTAPHFSYLNDLKHLEPQLRELDASFKENAFAQVDRAEPRSPAGIVALHVFREPPYTLTFREAVFWAFTTGMSDESELPTPRQLAVASLLAGQEIDQPRGAGTTVSEVIIKETRAMREIARIRGWLGAFLSPRIGVDDPARWMNLMLLPDVSLR